MELIYQTHRVSTGRVTTGRVTTGRVTTGRVTTGRVTTITFVCNVIRDGTGAGVVGHACSRIIHATCWQIAILVAPANHWNCSYLLAVRCRSRTKICGPALADWFRHYWTLNALSPLLGAWLDHGFIVTSYASSSLVCFRLIASERNIPYI